MKLNGNMEVGHVVVHTTQGRGHTPEEMTDMAMTKIMEVAETAPEPIKAQAIAFRHQLRNIILFYMRRSALSDRTTVISMLERVGDYHTADLIRKM